VNTGADFLNRTRKGRKRNSRKRGIALIITLSAVVLLTVLVLAFFTRAQLNRQIAFSDTNLTQSDMLARAGVDLVVGEIRREIEEVNATPSITDGATPEKTGVVNPDADVGVYTIVKVARQGVALYAGGQSLASGIAIDQRSLNGRKKSNWFATGPRLGSDDLPDWIYITRGNGFTIPVLADAKDRSKDDYVIGRFTYTVYDTSGMLDVNVAGYPTTTPFASRPEDVGTKASTTYADLTVLGMTTAEVDQLVAWRNARLAASSITAVEKQSLYDEWATGLPRSTGTPDPEALAAARSGHLEMAAGDNAFFSRRDFLRYVENEGFPDLVPSQMTHFSRAVNVPSWGPVNVAGSTIDYGDDADKLASPNRYLPNVTADAMTVRVYHDDGTYEEEVVESGELLVPRRFSLAKLAWIGHNGPEPSAFRSSLTASERDDAIERCFGLEWDGTKKRWIYDHGASNGIMTLDDVRKEDRYPDFFELLKAGILQGSLGGEPGAVANDITSTIGSDTAGPIGRHYDTYSASKNRHILQIGANIIDQADANNYPTAIYLAEFSQAGFSATENDFNNCVFGLENLPMLQRVGLINHLIADGADPGPMGMWMQPEFWNPHNPATAGSSPSDPNYPTPSALRVTTYGQCYLWNVQEDPSQAALSTPVDFGDDYENPNVEGTVCFKNPAPGSSSPPDFFDQPVVLTGFEAAADKNYSDSTCPSGPDNSHPSGVSWTGGNGRFLGVYLGDVYRDPRDADEGGSPQYKVQTVPDPSLSLVVEYYDGTDWRPYSLLNRVESVHPNGGGSGSRAGQVGWGSSDGHIDPRTDRFSGSAGRKGAGQNSAWGANRTVRANDSPDVGKGSASGRNPIFQAWPRASSGFIHDPLSGGELASNVSGAHLFDCWMMNLDKAVGSHSISRFRYQDPDAVIRPGDSWRADITTGDGMLTYHRNGAASTVASELRRRPVILNRPFRSVGELGYVFRDQPFKTLDLWSEDSADAGLLDLFCATATTSDVRAGQINPSAAPPGVIAAILSGATEEAGDATQSLSLAEAESIAAAVGGEVVSNGPLTDLSQLVTRFVDTVYNAYATVANTTNDKSANNKAYGETPVRALAANISDRVWNLLIDVAAQSGHLGPQADGLEDFRVEGERRYWLHLAIDRYTGEVIDSQMEPYYE
jgi:Tfp pilus assembly protein PilX